MANQGPFRAVHARRCCCRRTGSYVPEAATSVSSGPGGLLDGRQAAGSLDFTSRSAGSLPSAASHAATRSQSFKCALVGLWEALRSA